MSNVVEVVECEVARSRTQLIDHGVAGDAEEPRTEGHPGGSIAPDGLDHLHEYAMEEVLRVGRLSDAHRQVAIDARGVLIVQGREGFRVAGLGGGDQRVDVRFGPAEERVRERSEFELGQ